MYKLAGGWAKIVADNLSEYFSKTIIEHMARNKSPNVVRQRILTKFINVGRDPTKFFQVDVWLSSPLIHTALKQLAVSNKIDFDRMKQPIQLLR